MRNVVCQCAVILCGFVLACFNMVLGETHLLPDELDKQPQDHCVLCSKGLQKKSHPGPFGNPHF